MEQRKPPKEATFFMDMDVIQKLLLAGISLWKRSLVIDVIKTWAALIAIFGCLCPQIPNSRFFSSRNSLLHCSCQCNNQDRSDCPVWLLLPKNSCARALSTAKAGPELQNVNFLHRYICHIFDIMSTPKAGPTLRRGGAPDGCFSVEYNSQS